MFAIIDHANFSALVFSHMHVITIFLVRNDSSEKWCKPNMRCRVIFKTLNILVLSIVCKFDMTQVILIIYKFLFKLFTLR